MAERIRLSEHFELADFYDAGKYGDVLKAGEEAPAVEAREIDRRILRLMEGLWKKFGEKWPGCELVLTPHGGYRPGVLNARVGGAARSQHKRGNAADFRVRVKDGGYLPAAVIAVWAEKFMQDLGLRGGVGMYRAHHTYIHVDARGWNAAWFGSYSGAGCPGQGGRFCLYRKGTKGAGVIWIQKKLGIEADGVYGAKTERAVREFQKNAGIAADGIFGRETNRAMGDNKGGLLPW